MNTIVDNNILSPISGTWVSTWGSSATPNVQISSVENGYIVTNYNKQYVANNFEDLQNLLKTLLEKK